MSKRLKFHPKMYQVLTFILILILCLTALLYTTNTNSLDNAVTSIAPSVFELSIEIDNEQEVLETLKRYCSLDAYGLFLVYKWLVELIIESK